MKKSLIIGILGLAAVANSSYGQGTIALNNYHYSITGPLQDVVYGQGAGGTVGAGVNNTFTVGLYFVNVAGNYTANFAADPTGTAIPTSLYTSSGFETLHLAAYTSGIDNGDTDNTPGEYAAFGSFYPGLGGFVTVTVMLVAYNDGSYANATVRGHSAAFTMSLGDNGADPSLTGNFETDGGFAVFAVPEPSVFALSSLGGAALMLMRRKK